MQFITQPFGEVRIGDFLLGHLADPQWTAFHAAIAFVKRSGTQHICQSLRAFDTRADVRISVGVDMYGTSTEGLSDLLEAAQNGQVLVYRNNGPYTFHPKVYMFKSARRAEVLVGSGNLTSGGLFTNYEASIAVLLDLAEGENTAFLRVIEATLDQWAQPQEGICHLLTPRLIDRLVESGLVRSEAQLAAMREAAGAQQPPVPSHHEGGAASATAPAIFATRQVPGAPSVPASPASLPEPPIEPFGMEAEAAEAIAAASAQDTPDVPTFVISVLATDLPVYGSSNEVTITKHIRDMRPEFWGWRFLFRGPDKTTGQFRRDNIQIKYGTKVINAYLLHFPGNKPDGTKASSDFRLGSIAAIVADLRQEDDLILLSQSAEPNLDYVARVVRVGEPEHEELMNGMTVYAKSRSKGGTYRKFRYLG